MLFFKFIKFPRYNHYMKHLCLLYENPCFSPLLARFSRSLVVRQKTHHNIYPLFYNNCLHPFCVRFSHCKFLPVSAILPAYNTTFCRKYYTTKLRKAQICACKKDVRQKNKPPYAYFAKQPHIEATSLIILS